MTTVLVEGESDRVALAVLLGGRSGNKARYAALFAAAVEPVRIPPPLAALLAAADDDGP